MTAGRNLSRSRSDLHAMASESKSGSGQRRSLLRRVNSSPSIKRLREGSKTRTARRIGRKAAKALAKAADASPAAPALSCSAPLTAAEIAAASNKNMVSDYSWFLPLLEGITQNSVEQVVDTSSQAKGTPLFIVAGACPNSFSGMQAVMYSQMVGAASTVDFWWIKPMKADARTLERETLPRRGEGPHKNDPGRSKPVYAKFANLFLEYATEPCNGMRFCRGEVAGCCRAYIEEVSSGARLYIYLIWQEEWSSNPLARKPFIRGKIVYQREPQEARFFAQGYDYRESKLTLDGREESLPVVLPLVEK